MAKQTFTTGQVLTAAQLTSLQQTAMGGGSTTAKTTSYVLVAADAGTVVSVNSTSATTITVNTGLFAAGDTVFIQNWGSGSVTITAGTATVNTHGSLVLAQYEGGTLYFTSASAAIFFDISQTSGMTNPMTTTGDIIYSSPGSTPVRLGIGTANQVLTVNSGATAPEWKTPAGGGGKVLQVVQAETTTFTAIASTTYTDTTLSATITPTSATSKILIFANQNGLTYRDTTEDYTQFRILRGSTSIKDFLTGAGQEISGVSRAATHAITPLAYLDSPSTTSSTTYKVQARILYTANSGQYMAQRGSDVSTITLLEIGA